MKLRIFLFLLLTCSLFSQEGKWLPFDESNQDTALSRVLTVVKNAVATRNMSLLKEVLSDSLYINEEGAAVFVSQKKFLSHYKKNSYKELWDDLAEVLSVGGGGFVSQQNSRYGYRVFCAPYTSSDLIQPNSYIKEDIGEYAFILKDSVNVYEKPSFTAKVIGTLSYDIVKTGWEEGDHKMPQWHRIVLLHGRHGFVPTASIRGIHATDAVFILKNNAWKLLYVSAFC